FVPEFPLDRLFPGVFYLEAIGPDGVRAYARRPNDAERVNGEGRTLAPSLVQKEKEADFLPRVVVTGVACGLPGQDKVFEQDNLARLLEGQNCLEGLSAGSMAALVEKNVVQVNLAVG
ncbi:unnamed protein product, partial [Scytosiphon promiscuus]